MTRTKTYMFVYTLFVGTHTKSLQISSSRSCVRYILRYNPQADSWEFVEPMHVCRGGVGLAALGGYLFAIGGHDGKTYLNTAEMYCPKTKSWTMVASMKTSRAGAGVVACPVTSLNLNLNANSGSIPESLGSL